MMRALLLAGVVTLGWMVAVQAATITFETAPFGPNFNGPVTESGFTYSRRSGGLYVNSYGNPGRDMEGQSASNDGVLDIVSAGDLATFSFSALDYAAFSNDGSGSQTLTVTGLLGGLVVGTDSYTLTNTSTFRPTYSNWTTEVAANLSGKTIDDLRITLNVNSNSNESIDNVVLTAAATAVPEPASLALLGLGVAGVAAVRRRRAS